MHLGDPTILLLVPRLSEAPAVPSNGAVTVVAIPKYLFPATPSAFVCSDPMKRHSGDPVLVTRPLLLWLVARVAYSPVKMRSPCQRHRQS